MTKDAAKAEAYRIKFLKDHPGVSCMGCWHLQPMGIKCNIHRTESTATKILRLADEAGLVLISTNRRDRVFEAERLLGLPRITI